jgi:phytoene dehydrogenase-like protein
MQKNAHIIGAGISGLSAAVRLANSGYRVHVHEATQQTGGRCRSYFDAATNLTIDNGNHLLLSGEIDRHRGRAGRAEARAVSLRRHHDRPALAARPR